MFDTTPSMTHYLGKIETSCSAYVYELLVIGLGPKKDRVYMIVSSVSFSIVIECNEVNRFQNTMDLWVRSWILFEKDFS